MRKSSKRNCYDPTTGGNTIFIPDYSIPDYGSVLADVEEEKAIEPDPPFLSNKEADLCDAIDVLEKTLDRARQDNEILRKEVERLSNTVEIVLPHSSYIRLIEQACSKNNFELKLSIADGRVIHLKVKN